MAISNHSVADDLAEYGDAMEQWPFSKRTSVVLVSGANWASVPILWQYPSGRGFMRWQFCSGMETKSIWSDYVYRILRLFT